MFSDTQLDGLRALSDYNIVQGSTLQLSMPFRGAPADDGNSEDLSEPIGWQTVLGFGSLAEVSFRGVMLLEASVSNGLRASSWNVTYDVLKTCSRGRSSRPYAARRMPNTTRTCWPTSVWGSAASRVPSRTPGMSSCAPCSGLASWGLMRRPGGGRCATSSSSPFRTGSPWRSPTCPMRPLTRSRVRYCGCWTPASSPSSCCGIDPAQVSERLRAKHKGRTLLACAAAGIFARGVEHISQRVELLRRLRAKFQVVVIAVRLSFYFQVVVIALVVVAVVVVIAGRVVLVVVCVVVVMVHVWWSVGCNQ